MKRKIIVIDEDKCDGCGACIHACHEQALTLVDGVAKLQKEDYCDGLGDCLPACPRDAISFEVKEVAAYDEVAVQKHIARSLPGDSALQSWPVQLALAPIHAPMYHQAKLLIAADCAAYAYGNFHNDFMKDHVLLIGCPKLDSYAYIEKLKEIFNQNEIQEVHLVRMEVPCCGGLVKIVQNALNLSTKTIPWKVTTISRNGKLL